MKFSGYLFFIILILPAAVMAQQNDSITLKASERYNKSSFYKLFFGEHYRKEWHTPVKFKIAYLDTLAGGLIPYKAGGGRQSKSLRLHDKNNREYVLRSIDKTFGKALPEIAQGTFIEDVIDDQVTIANPYAAVTIAPLAEAAGILHTKPKIYYIPKQKNLGEFNDSFGDKLYLFEQRPDEDWTTADNFANASNIIGTEKLYEKYLKDADNRIDQKLFLRSRLFDMLIGDWGRHDDQWRWAEFKKDGNTLYKPIPRDRDQAYTKFDGILLKILIPAVHAKHLQTFNYKIKDLYHYNFTARNLDHFFLNELTLSDWLDIANDIKYRLSDEIIDDAVKQLPPEVYNISGKEIAEKIKARRNDLPKYAGKYFKQVNEMVSIAGSKKKELFKINRLNDTLTEVKVYKIKDTNELVYSRVFNNRQTKELRIFGIDGNDKYVVEGNTRKGIKIRLIGGADKDIYNISSNVKSSGKQTKIYDSKGNDIIDDRDTKVNIYTENKMPRFSWEQYQYKKSGFLPMFFYNNDDRFYVGLSYHRVVSGWQRSPFASSEYIDVKYSLTQKGFSSTYSGTFKKLIGAADLKIYANYDQVRWLNFYGLGNTTPDFKDSSSKYNLTRSEQFKIAPGIEFNSHNRFRFLISPYFSTYTILDDPQNIGAKFFSSTDPQYLKTKKYLGLHSEIVYQVVNDSILPVKGFSILGMLNDVQNINNSKNVFRYGGQLNLYLPLAGKIGLVTKFGAASLTGDPEFYQYNNIGGGQTLRGYERERFHGQTAVYNQNELRFITNIRSKIYNGKIGIFGLADVGRVWIKGENSNKWHPSYGGGILVSPFNKITGTAAIAFSPEGYNVHLGIVSPF